MKFLIVGLGNIGAEYENTRHNIGFNVLDFLAKKLEVEFQTKTLGDVAVGKHRGKTFVMLKPSTYMNRSGKSLRYWMQMEKVQMDHVLVVLDDLNLTFGKQRLRPNGSDGGHNGLKDIDLALSSNNYARLRIGIGSEFHKGKQVDFVLGKWREDENKLLPDILSYATDTCLSFGAIGLAHTMNQFNKK
ncbi:MAG: aminoacyl-tRNA hydrolase [Saprospiraceae bacterium]|nr:aminoacyl-tRNA hydrolase [Saprospiraceae bacterium]